MRIIEINLGNYGSTGKIMQSIAKAGEAKGFSFLQMYPMSVYCKKNKNDFIICSEFLQKVFQKLYYYTGFSDCWDKIGTRRMIRKIKSFKPDIIHFHNLHNNYLDLKPLFRFIANNNIRVVWTLHDCWPITGRCPHFTILNCDKWKYGCCECPYEKRSYPATIIDKTAKMWARKKSIFTNIDNMMLVTPSCWLSTIVKQSFLGHFPVKVINNGIDLKIFKPTISTIREKYGITNKFVILGVSFEWGEKKGLDVFIRLSQELPDYYQIILVGVNDELKSSLPKNIISIKRTQDQTELAKFYSSADVFVNPTREDNYPTVNMESLACGTPVITFNTGGSPEIIDITCGSVVAYDDINALKEEIIRTCKEKPFSKDCCLKKAKQFNMDDRYNEYLCLYEAIANK